MTRDDLKCIALAVTLPLLLAACGGESPKLADDAPGEWRQWRGPAGQGISTEAPLPRRWRDDTANVTWKTPIPGIGNSSPIVSRGRVFVTTAMGSGQANRLTRFERIRRTVLALDLETGDLLWQRAVFTTGHEKRHPMNTPAAATPAADGERLFVYFGMGLAALDYEGNVLWSQEVDPNYLERSRYGVVSSPVLTEDAVLIARDDEWGGDTIEDISWLAAYDKETGRELWRTENDETCCSYTTPLLFERPSGTEVIFASTPFVAGYDLATGERLWTADHTLRQIVPSPLIAGDIFVLPGSVHMGSLTVWRLSGEGTGTGVEALWDGRGAPKIPSPVTHDGVLYLVNDRGVVSAWDLVSGKRHWMKRLASGNYHASLVAGDGKVYAVNDTCTTSVIAAGPRYRLLAENPLDGRCAASPAIAAGSLLIRSTTDLYRVSRLPPKETASSGKPATGEKGVDKKKRGKGRRKKAAEDSTASP